MNSSELNNLLNNNISEYEQLEIYLVLAIRHNDFKELEIRNLIETITVDGMKAEALASALFECFGLYDGTNNTIYCIGNGIYELFDFIDVSLGALITYESLDEALNEIKRMHDRLKSFLESKSMVYQIFLLFFAREMSQIDNQSLILQYSTGINKKTVNRYREECPAFFIDCYSSLGSVLSLPDVIEWNNLAISLIDRTDDEEYTRTKLLCIYNIANVYYIDGRLQDADKELNRIINDEDKYVDELSDILSIAYTLKAENYSVLYKDSYDESYELLMKAHSLLDNIKDDAAYNSAYLMLCKFASKFFLDNSEFKRSEAFSNDLYRAYQEGFGSVDDYLVALHNLALSYSRQGLINKSKEKMDDAVKFVLDNNLQETNLGKTVLHTNSILFANDLKSVINRACDAIYNFKSINIINYYDMADNVRNIVISNTDRRRILPYLKNVIDGFDRYTADINDPAIKVNTYMIKAYYLGFAGNYSEAGAVVRKAADLEIASGYKFNVVIYDIGKIPDFFERMFSKDDFKTLLFDLIKGFPYRAWELLRLSDEMSLFKNLSFLSECYKFVLSEHFRHKIELTDEELVEIVINCKNYYPDLLKVRKEIIESNPWYDDEYRDVNCIHKDIINLELGSYFKHVVAKEEIERLKEERHKAELNIIEDVPFHSLGWMSLFEIEGHMKENDLYVDYLVIPSVVGKDVFLKDEIYLRIVMFKCDGKLRIKVLPHKTLLEIRYQFEMLERLLREKYGKSKIFSLGRLLKGDNIVLSSLYKDIIKEAIQFSKSFGMIPKNLIISGDAELSSFPFDTLIDEQGKYLIEKYNVINVNSLRNYFGSVSLKEGDEQFATVIGNPSFTIDQSIVQNIDNEKYLVQIPLSKIEAQAVADEIDTRPILRNEACKSVLVDNGCRILHIATHGDHLDADYANEMRENGVYGEVTNPMLTNCIFMSGANDWIVKNELNLDYGNGIISAEELCTYRLPILKLVVLSACFTGSGDISYSLGLIGMRTALMTTGARAIVTSLWEVDDFASAVFMTQFYKNMRSNDIATSLRLAKIYLMNVTLDELSSEGWFGENRIRRLGLVAEDMKRISKQPPETRLFEKPFYWAGFSLIIQ